MKVSYYILLISLFLFGCEKTAEDSLLTSSIPPELTVSAGKKWLEQNPSRLLSHTSALWQLGERTTFEGSPVVIVPVYNPGGSLRITSDADGDGQVEELGRQSFIFYHDENNEITASLMAAEESVSAPKSIYFFSYHDLALQSIWQVENQVLTGYSAAEPNRPANARSETCGFFDKWINHCDETARSTSSRPCWEYAGRVWSCIPDLGGEIPGTGGGPSGGTPTPRPTPGIDYTPPPATGFSPFLNRPFAITLGQNKLEVLLANQKPAKMIPLILAASIKSNTYFSEEELAYLETFSEEELAAMANWVNDFPNLEISALEHSISRLKKKFNKAEKDILFSYSGNNTFKYRLNVLRYGANAYAAITATHGYFGSKFASECPDCKGNAFKHALFRVFDAVSFGREISRQLGEAHESEQALDASTIMDKKNNETGLRIYDNHKNGGTGAFYWGTKVGDSMKNGDLVFLIHDREVRSNIDDPTIRGPL